MLTPETPSNDRLTDIDDPTAMLLNHAPMADILASFSSEEARQIGLELGIVTDSAEDLVQKARDLREG